MAAGSAHAGRGARPRLARAIAIVAAATALAACGPPPAADPAPPRPGSAPVAAGAPPAAVAPRRGGARGDPGPAARTAAPPVIPRAALDRVLDAGPGAFLARLEIEPRLRRGRFSGWVVVRFFPGDPRFRAADIRPGDVITAVNGHPLKRPEDLFAVWKQLRSARAAALVVTGERNGVPFERRFAIVGSPPRHPAARVPARPAP